MCPLVQLGGMRLSAYWLLSVCGVAVAALYMALTARGGKVGHVAWYHLWTIFCIAMVSAFVGGKVAGILVNIPKIIRNGSIHQVGSAAFWKELTAGRSFYGGYLLLVGLLWWYSRKNGLSLDVVGAISTPSIAIFMTFGRIGCYLAGCCYGVPVSWGVTFPAGSLAPAGIPLFPSQLAEAAVQFLLFVALAVLSRRDARKWLVFPLYLGGYGTLRFILEFWRGDAARGIWLLSVGQWTSIALMAIAAALLYRHATTRPGAHA